MGPSNQHHQALHIAHTAPGEPPHAPRRAPARPSPRRSAAARAAAAGRTATRWRRWRTPAGRAARPASACARSGRSPRSTPSRGPRPWSRCCTAQRRTLSHTRKRQRAFLHVNHWRYTHDRLMRQKRHRSFLNIPTDNTWRHALWHYDNAVSEKAQDIFTFLYYHFTGYSGK